MSEGIVDVVFKNLFRLLGWCVEAFFKGVFWMIKALWRLIFPKKKKPSDDEEVQALYKELLDKITNAKEMDYEELVDIGSRQTLLNAFMSVDQKCSILEAMNKFASPQTDDRYNSLFNHVINHSYVTLKHNMPPDFMMGEGSDFKKAVESGALKSYQPYLIDIMSIASAIGGNSETIEASQLAKYKLPEFRATGK